MRAVVLAVLLVGAGVGCRADEAIIDAPATPSDASDGGVATDGIPTDAGGCAACGSNQVCVAFHDGVCSSNIRVECQDRHPLCEGVNCIQDRDCEFWHCRGGMDAGSPYT